MAAPRRFDLEDILNRPGTYFNPETEVLLVIDDAPEVDQDIFEEDGDGGEWVLLVMIYSFGSDTLGYFSGRAFGKHKLYEAVSPKKTVEGSIGGLGAGPRRAFRQFAKQRWHRRPRVAGGRIGAIVAIAAAIGHPAGIPAIGHGDRHPMAARREHAAEWRLAFDLARS